MWCLITVVNPSPRLWFPDKVFEQQRQLLIVPGTRYLQLLITLFSQLRHLLFNCSLNTTQISVGGATFRTVKHRSHVVKFDCPSCYTEFAVSAELIDESAVYFGLCFVPFGLCFWHRSHVVKFDCPSCCTEFAVSTELIDESAVYFGLCFWVMFLVDFSSKKH